MIVGDGGIGVAEGGTVVGVDAAGDGKVAVRAGVTTTLVGVAAGVDAASDVAQALRIKAIPIITTV